MRKKQADAMLQQCYADYRLKLFNYCLSRLDGSREAADDCVQEAFIVFYNRLIEGEEFENQRAFLYRTADNFVKRQKQRLAKEIKHNIPLDEARDCESPDINQNGRLDEIDYEKCAKRLIEQLSNNEKQLYELRYQQKLSVESVALTLAISRPAASMRLIRLRNKVESMVYDLNIEEKGG